MEIKKLNSSQLVQEFIQTVDKYKTYNLLLAGGTTPKNFYALLSKIDFKMPANCMLADERVVPKHTPKSNETMLLQTELLPKLKSKSNYTSILTGLKPKQEAERVDSIIKKDFTSNTICILGMGLDGHIAGIMPKSKALKSENLFVYSRSLWSEKNRLTITKYFIQNFTSKVILLVKDERLSILEDNFENPKNPLSILSNKNLNIEIIVLL